MTTAGSTPNHFLLTRRPPSKKMRIAEAAPPALAAPEHEPVSDPFDGFVEFTLNLERYKLLDDDAPAPPPPKADGAPCVKPADISLENWRLHKRDKYLTTLLRSHGTAGADLVTCPGCSNASGTALPSLPLPRLLRRSPHRENPLHRIEYWNDAFFVKVFLAMIGLHVQLGHPPHSPCSAPEPGIKGFVVLHGNGIEEVAVNFCACEHAVDTGSHEVQLLRAGWFPATHERPQTCATIALLEKYHIEAVESKTTLYHAYAALEKMTDNTGNKPPDRYHEWIRMGREWFHLTLLKHAARAIAYCPSGVHGTKQGECAVKCPACPRPGVNLPPGWEDAEPEQRFMYTLFLALDACFRLKRRLVSSELRDPDLGSGWAYNVETGPYREYLRTVTNQKEMQTCSGLAALDYANTKFSRGYATTGVAMGVCGWHEFVQAKGVGDLQKGERFSNVNYVFASISKHWPNNLHKLTTYDIVCIWSIYLVGRLGDLPEDVRACLTLAFIRFAIPKMHIHAHTLACQLLYSLNLLIGSAQLDAEGIERAWSILGALAASTRDMGPGARHDMLDTQIAGMNWQKLVTIVELLRKRLDRATQELQEQKEAFDDFSAQQADRVPQWRQEVLDFEADPTAKNPYSVPMKGLTEAEVQLHFSKMEEEEARRGVPSLHDTTTTANMQVDMGALRTKLNRGIARFCKIEQIYMPVAIQALGALELPAETVAENVPLLLPSALAPVQRERCVPGLEHIEGMMRDVQCRTGLTRLRTQLHVKSRLLLYKMGHARHQGATTRSRTVVTRNETKVRLHSEKYQTAWEALCQLNGGDAAMVGWKALRRQDIRCMGDTEDLRKKAKRKQRHAEFHNKRMQELRAGGLLEAEEDEKMDWEDVEDDVVERGPENERQTSWIWRGADGTDAGLEKVEWSKAFARTRRWDEEKRLILEEYRRVGVSLEYEAKKWEERAGAVPEEGMSAEEAAGAVAYALRQARMYRDLIERGAKPQCAVEEDAGAEMENHGDRGEIEDDEEYAMAGEGLD
ncbi:hypothetical protein C8R46DRAFT_1238064 [Mycena filopes]|nr:hypothetical protein C8R46DRAFT_1238064 [Mycena filopes]